MAVSLGGVLAVFNNVEIKAAQLTPAKVVYFMEYLMKLVGAVAGNQLSLKLSCTTTNPAV